MNEARDRQLLEAARARLANTDPADEPLLSFWRELIPDDFDPTDTRKVLSLDFELSGIERGFGFLRQIENHAPIKGKRVLDIGAGNGGLCIACALAGAASTSGIEIEESRIELARRWAACRGVNIDVRLGVAEQLPFGDDSFDVVFLSSVIEHVEDQEKSISELARVLRKGGVFFLDGPNRLSPRWFIQDPHYRIAAVSVMPEAIGRWWVVKVRRLAQHYSVGVFPIFSVLVKTLERHGLTVLESGHNSYLLSVLVDPKRVRKGPKRTLLAAGSRLGINRALAAVLRNTTASFWIVGTKA
jgi:2-polyprenyl-3-methyl-5-hydroxy-6-metoxy-1,4-benzoquinol methylase